MLSEVFCHINNVSKAHCWLVSQVWFFDQSWPLIGWSFYQPWSGHRPLFTARHLNGWTVEEGTATTEDRSFDSQVGTSADNRDKGRDALSQITKQMFGHACPAVFILKTDRRHHKVAHHQIDAAVLRRTIIYTAGRTPIGAKRKTKFWGEEKKGPEQGVGDSHWYDSAVGGTSSSSKLILAREDNSMPVSCQRLYDIATTQMGTQMLT